MRRESVIALAGFVRRSNVSPSGYYDWVDRLLSETVKANRRLITKIGCHHKASRSTYGSLRIQRDLLDDGDRVSHLVDRSKNIQSKMAKRFVITTNSKSTTSPASDRLKRNFRTEDKK